MPKHYRDLRESAPNLKKLHDYTHNPETAGKYKISFKGSHSNGEPADHDITVKAKSKDHAKALGDAHWKKNYKKAERFHTTMTKLVEEKIND